jgi:hypothetical protein
MYRKKWQHIAIFCFTGLVSCVKGKAILVVLHPSGAFIEPNPERTEWICFPGSQIYESSIYIFFFLSKTCSTRKPPKEEEEEEEEEAEIE